MAEVRDDHDGRPRCWAEATAAAKQPSRMAMEVEGLSATMGVERPKKFEPITKWEFDVEGQPANNIEEDDDDYLRNPLPENEHVGVDEEIMYLDIVPMNVVDVPGCSEKGKEKAVVEDGSEDESEDGSEEEFEDEDELEADEDEPYKERNTEKEEEGYQIIREFHCANGG
ncbi:unnamed protein product [Miscanthus lutarioriparius]|uniref:Uncharacterized protein n=1 Tax=Miscanthus lutarioriparius TaxID=422564 RepID=A0A811RXY8_9POAL|nr:unnamed protein product [Miscanthus lutarioriparius]